ncbi:MAG TPA: peptide chain release factor 2 [Patescibacteria group bacterium]|nr:peptide chain release factor 2 [Patescibacteria group bacterium]
MEDLKEKVNQMSIKYTDIVNSLNLEEKRKRINELEAKSVVTDFWKDASSARKVMQELGDLKSEITDVEKLEGDINTLKNLVKTQSDLSDFADDVKDAEKKLENLNSKSFLSGDYDSKNAILAIHAGQGGTEAMDWTSMLYRMYLRYAEKKGYKATSIDVSQGEEAGIKSITFKIEGLYAYGYLKGEAGTHRLVRQSPFNADKLRQTSFALVEVLPELEEVDLPGIEIKAEDLELQFFRSSSQGGQNVQKVSTAVRIKHVPTGIVVSSQTQRFQEQNRKLAMGLLRAKLWLLEQEKQKRKVKELKGEYRPASWGTQIRSYVLHPYKMVKDLRTGVESSQPENVLAGDLDEFIEAELKLNN